MRRISIRVLLCTLALFALNAEASAQVHEDDVRLYLDLGLVGWTSYRVRADYTGDWLAKDNTLSAGPAAEGMGGIGVGYAVTPHIVPGLYFSLQHVKQTSSVERDDDEISDSEATNRRFELRPYLEIPFNPRSRFVVHGLAGLSFLRQVGEGDDDEAFGVGPVFGLGGHGFILPAASLDLGLLFRAAFVKNDQVEDALEASGADDVKQRELALLFTLGASFWL